MSGPEVAVIVVAAGEGTRLGAGLPKALVPLGGSTVLARALDAVAGMAQPCAVVVVAPAGHLEEVRSVSGGAVVVAGGASRQDSVAAGIAALPDGARIVLVHDAARPLASPALFDRVAAEVRASGDGIVPAVPVADTVKRLGIGGAVAATVDRTELVAVQTPQGFPRAVLERAYAEAAAQATDDAALVAAIGHPVRAVEGEPLAFKITGPDDLERAAALVAGTGSARLRTGIGADAHALVPGVPLRLGALDWPEAPEGLAGHSDGDAVCHALVDALLSAAGLGDIGTRFGTEDPRYAGASGAVFLRETVALLGEEGWEVRSAAVEVIAGRPRIGPRRAEMEATLSALLGAPVSVAGTTSDGLGIAGEGRGIAAVATALVARLG